MKTVWGAALVSWSAWWACPVIAADPIQLPPIEVRASYPLVPAAYRDTPVPSYPAGAREQGLEGVAILGVRVDAGGKVSEIQVKASSGAKMLDDAAVAAVKAWTFVPARKGPQPVESWVEVPVRFALTRK